MPENQNSLLLMAGLENLRSLALIGMSKNAGKTTCLNHIIMEWQATKQTRPLALTSIGRDGESDDILSGRAKPRIYVPKGTLIATAEGALRRCDALLEILELSNIRTAFGEVVLCRALSDGYVELAGPATTEEMGTILDLVRSHEPEALFIIDGALSRRSQAGSGASESVILAVSAETSSNPEHLAEKTHFALEILQTPSLDPVPKKLLLDFLNANKKVRVVCVNGPVEKAAIRGLETPSVIGFGKDIAGLLRKDTQILFLKGAITDQVIEILLKEPEFSDLTLVAEDGTRLFIKPGISQKLSARRIALAVLNPLDVRLVALNPTRTNSQSADASALLESLRQKLDVPVADFGPANI